MTVTAPTALAPLVRFPFPRCGSPRRALRGGLIQEAGRPAATKSVSTRVTSTPKQEILTEPFQGRTRVVLEAKDKGETDNKQQAQREEAPSLRGRAEASRGTPARSC